MSGMGVRIVGCANETTRVLELLAVPRFGRKATMPEQAAWNYYGIRMMDE
jgi:hypothetical protein